MARFQYTEFDTRNQFDWTSIQYTIEDDIVVNTRTLFDAGYEVFGTYENEVLRREFFAGTDEALGFNHRNIEYDADGKMTVRGTVYPNSLRVTENFQNGVPSETLLSDGFFGDGAQPWNQILISYDPAGNIIGRTTTYDNGTRTVETFEPGQFDSLYDSLQVKSWETIDTQFDADGDRTGRTTVYDNGTSKTETWADGQRVSITNSDNSDAKSWDEISTLFDAEGNRSEKTTVNDDGTVTHEIWANGLRVSIEKTDEQDAASWERIETIYDDAGNKAEKTSVYDNGTVTHETWSNGLRVSVVKTDEQDAKSWERIETTYDDDGNKAEKTTLYDDGSARIDTWVNGQRASIVNTDEQDAKSWDSINTVFDDEGNKSEKTTVYDNGTITRETWADGQRVSIVKTDEQNAESWDSIVTTYRDGVISERRTENDNGDVTVSIYSDGKRAQILQFDGDDSAPWVLQVTDYPAEGPRVVTRYETVDDIPDALSQHFPELTPPVVLEEFVLDFNDRTDIEDGDQVLDGEFTAHISKGINNLDGFLNPSEYLGTTTDSDSEATNAWAATVGFSKSDGEEFDFRSVSLANSSQSQFGTSTVPEEYWADQVTINAYNDDVLIHSSEVNLTFDHMVHEFDWRDIDFIEFVASGGEITNDHVENSGWFSMDDLTFLA